METSDILSIIALSISGASMAFAGAAFLRDVVAKRPHLKLTALIRDVMTSEGSGHPDQFIVSVLNVGVVDVHLYGLYAFESPRFLPRFLRRRSRLRPVTPATKLKMKAWPIEVKRGQEKLLLTDDAESFLRILHRMGIPAGRCAFAVVDVGGRRFYSNTLRTSEEDLVVE